MKKIAVVGGGFVGSVTATCFADVGNQVICTETNPDRLGAFKQGDVPFYEQGLEERVRRNIDRGTLVFSDDNEMAARESDIIFLAVPTPQGDDGSADLSFLAQAGRDIGPGIRDYAGDGKKLVVIKSTAPPEAVGVVNGNILQQGVSQDQVEIVVNPETLKEGTAVSDFEKPDRILIGADSTYARQEMAELYRPFRLRNAGKIRFMEPKAASLVKYFSNDYLAMRITYFNFMARLCDEMGIDFNDVRDGVTSDARIGTQFSHAGPGFGGSCFPKDTPALRKIAEQAGLVHPYADRTVDFNKGQKQYCGMRLIDGLGPDPEGKIVAIWGAAYKANTSDIRESAFLPIADLLVDAGVQVRVCDPEATEEVKQRYSGRIECYDESQMYEILNGANALTVLTEWNCFRSADHQRIKQNLANDARVFDFRNLWEPSDLAEAGLEFYVLGRSKTFE